MSNLDILIPGLITAPSFITNAVLGENVAIGPFTTIGMNGFGFEVEDPTTTRPKYKIPLKRKEHKYRVIIGDNVEIGSSCSIDRGSWRDTVIGPGTKIDSLVKIAHNVQIGRNCLVVAGTVIGGSCTIEDNCFLGINSGIRQRLTIGENAFIGMGSVVVKDVSANMTVKGNPAK